MTEDTEQKIVILHKKQYDTIRELGEETFGKRLIKKEKFKKIVKAQYEVQHRACSRIRNFMVEGDEE